MKKKKRVAVIETRLEEKTQRNTSHESTKYMYLSIAKGVMTVEVPEGEETYEDRKKRSRLFYQPKKSEYKKRRCLKERRAVQ